MNPILERYSGRLPFTVQERDIDLLLLEQLHVCREFAAWLIAKLGLSGGEVITAHHSVSRTHGETDVLLHVQHGDQRVAVMIEDKIGAPMQPNQCERYHLRGKIMCDEGEADCYQTVLCAPAGYLAGVPKDQPWDHHLPFEDIAHLVESIGSPGWEWRQAILLSAFSRAARAREADSGANKGAYDAMLVQLKRAYRSFVEANYPQILASRQEGRDREYYLRGRGLPTGIRFKHAFFRGEISLIFENAWVTRAEPWLATHLPEGAWIMPHGRELHVRMSVDVMDPIVPFDQQEDIAAAALNGISSMIGWAESVAEASPARLA